jgi:hypothetical protein
VLETVAVQTIEPPRDLSRDNQGGDGLFFSPISIVFFLKFLKIPKKLFLKSFFGGVKGQSPLRTPVPHALSA